MGSIRGVKITRQTKANLSTQFEHRTDPRNRSYFWYGGLNAYVPGNETDEAALLENYISITPIQCDITDYSVMADLADIQFN